MKAQLSILLLRLLSLLPLRVARALGVVCGEICWRLRTRMAQTTLINLTLCLPELDAAQRTALARKSLHHTFMTAAETGAIWLWPAPKTLALISRVDGLTVLDSAHASGRGVIVLTPHHGHWELMGLYLGSRYPSSQLYQALEHPALDRLVYTARSRGGAHMVATDAKGVGELLQRLRHGECAGILPDQVPPDSGGEFAPFFGVPALTMTLVSRLQQKTGARIVMCWARRDLHAKHGFTIIFREPDDLAYAKDMPSALEGLNRSVESLVRSAPEQYQWGYKRFKRQPPGSDRPY